MRWLIAALLLLAQQTPLPPAYPRPGATKLLENDRIIVWQIAWLKQQYPLHRHPYDLSGVYYSPGDRMIISPDGSRRPVSTKAGEIPFQKAGVTHIEEGTSDMPLKAVFFEMKQDAPSAAAPAIIPGGQRFPGAGAAAKQLLDNERVTAWELPTTRPLPHTHAYDTLVVGLKAETPHVKFVTRGTTHDDEGVTGDDRAWAFAIK